MSGTSSTHAVQSLPDDMLYHYGAVLGVIMACAQVDKSQVQKLLEVIGSNPSHAHDMLLAFVAYQAARDQLGKGASRLVARQIVDALTRLANMKRGKLSQEELLKVFGIAKWVYQATQMNKSVCKSFNLMHRFDQILSRLPSIAEIIKQITGVR